MKKTYIVQPLKQLIVWEDPLINPAELSSAIEKLNPDLSFKRTVFRYDGTPRECFREAVSEGVIRPVGWIEITREPINEFSDIWPEAMERLGQGKLYDPSKKNEVILPGLQQAGEEQLFLNL